MTSSTSLRKAIASLDAKAARVTTTTTAAQATVPVTTPPAAPLTELRAWRMGMAKRFIGLSIMPSPAQKDSKR